MKQELKILAAVLSGLADSWRIHETGHAELFGADLDAVKAVFGQGVAKTNDGVSVQSLSLNSFLSFVFGWISPEQGQYIERAHMSEGKMLLLTCIQTPRKLELCVTTLCLTTRTGFTKQCTDEQSKHFSGEGDWRTWG